MGIKEVKIRSVSFYEHEPLEIGAGHMPNVQFNSLSLLLFFLLSKTS